MQVSDAGVAKKGTLGDLTRKIMNNAIVMTKNAMECFVPGVSKHC